jgi:hypothetical protein
VKTHRNRLALLAAWLGIALVTVFAVLLSFVHSRRDGDTAPGALSQAFFPSRL